MNRASRRHRLMLRVLLPGLLGCAVLAACGDSPGTAAAPQPDAAGGRSASSGMPRFTDVTAETGLDLTIVSGRQPAQQLIESMGAGIGLIDYDRDGDLDVFVPNGATLDAPTAGAGCRLFENLGGLRFADVTEAAGLTWSGWGMAVAVGDIDGDGWDDLYIPAFGANALLRNTGNGGFVDVTAAAGVGDDRWGAAAAFGDLDGDGDLDLYLANYFHHPLDEDPPYTLFKGVPVPRGPEGMLAQPDIVYRNRGDGTFVNASVTWGFSGPRPSYGLGVVILDLDDDGRNEVFVGNDSEENFLFDADPSDDAAAATGTDTAGTDETDVDAANAGAAAERHYVDRAMVSAVALSGMGRDQATMGITVADVDGNGHPDLFSTNFSSDTNTLHVNLDGALFADRTEWFGLGSVSRTSLGWSAMFYDFDHDADEDLLVVNGHVFPQATTRALDSEYRQRPLLFVRDGDRFHRARPAQSGDWLDEPHADRGTAFGDLDGDGDIDVVISELNGPVRVLRNDSEKVGGWLIVELQDTRPGSGNPRGLGARVRLHAGHHRALRWIYSGGGYASASGTFAHFGVPPGHDTVGLQVRWPDGFEQELEAVATGQRLVITRK